MQDYEIRQLSTFAEVDLRTAKKWARGERVRGRPGERCARVAKERGYRRAEPHKEEVRRAG